MVEPKVFFVHLRRPRSARVDPNEQRDDPFYEFGSFGCTGCHSKNLFNSRHADELEGARLAFVQGGKMGFRLVFLTPPVKVRKLANRCEARWTPRKMPFKYTEAPILAWNEGPGDFPLVEKFAGKTNRTTLEGGLSSRIRARARPLDAAMAKEVVSIYETFLATASLSSIASSYDEALPHAPPRVDKNRKSTYERRIAKLTGDASNARKTPSKSRCGPP
jgi:hypothetical protein